MRLSADWMITISDNITNALLRLAGFERLRRDMGRWDYPRHANAVILTMRRRQEGSPTMCAWRSVCCWSRSIEEASAVKQYRRMRKRSSCCSRSATKIPGYIAEAKIANKTGESGKVTHDGAIVFAEKPFVLVICSEDTDVPGDRALHVKLRQVSHQENSAE